MHEETRTEKPVVIRNFAFREGVAGRAQGCDHTENPYDDGRATGRKHAISWLNGWIHADKQGGTPVEGLSFVAATRMCILALQEASEVGKKIAADELLRFARELDRLAAQKGTSFDAETQNEKELNHD